MTPNPFLTLFASRKFALTVLAVLVTTGLVLADRIKPDQFVTVVAALVGVLVAAIGVEDGLRKGGAALGASLRPPPLPPNDPALHVPTPTPQRVPTLADLDERGNTPYEHRTSRPTAITPRERSWHHLDVDKDKE